MRVVSPEPLRVSSGTVELLSGLEWPIPPIGGGKGVYWEDQGYERYAGM